MARGLALRAWLADRLHEEIVAAQHFLADRHAAVLGDLDDYLGLAPQPPVRHDLVLPLQGASTPARAQVPGPRLADLHRNAMTMDLTGRSSPAGSFMLSGYAARFAASSQGTSRSETTGRATDRATDDKGTRTPHSHEKRETRYSASPTKYQTSTLRSLVAEAERPPDAWLERTVNSKIFEAFSGITILLNVCTMAIKVQMDGIERGNEIGFPSIRGRVVNDRDDIYLASEIIFTALFSIELALRIASDRLEVNRFRGHPLAQKHRHCFISCWLWFDLSLIVLGAIDIMAYVRFPLSPTLLRLLRLARVLRLLKLLNTVAVFDSLYLLVRSIQASVGALFWSFILLVMLQIFTGLILASILAEYIDDDDKPIDSRHEVFEYFGTFSRAVLTMYEITLSNWVPSCRLLMEDVSEWYSLFYIIYRCSFCFAVIRVITAVFIAETNRMIQQDDIMMIRKKQKMKESLHYKLRAIFNELHNGSGAFKWQDFEAKIQDDLIKAWLSAMDIEVTDLRAVFQILDDVNIENGVDTVEEMDFVDGLGLLRGQARALDVIILRRELDTIRKQLGHANDNMRHVIDDMERLGQAYPIVKAHI